MKNLRMKNLRIKNLVIRREIKLNEFRVPIIPNDCARLLNDFTIYVEKSPDRCFPDSDYEKCGCILINDYTKLDLDLDQTLIVGLKELDYTNDKLFRYRHLFFSHTYKNQSDSKYILSKFKKAQGTIYDLEYLVDDNNRRLIAFGYWAGFIGMAISLLQYQSKSVNVDLVSLQPLNDYNILINQLKSYANTFKDINVGIIGPNGRCGKGCRFLLDSLSIKYVGYGRSDKLNNLTDHDIIINCIKLEKDAELTIISETMLEKPNKISIINDVSCDITAENNPIKLKYCLTTFEKPIYKYNDNLDIICIDNLPSLLPIDSSTEFSNKLSELILMINDSEIWSNVEKLYYEKISDI